jgi:broad specificity phosphatase PhoE
MTCWQTIGVPILLIRHANAGARSEWAGDDRLRPLSRKGARQAAALVKKLTPLQPDRILSSPYVRCVQTVEPLAERLAVKVETTEELAEGSVGEAIALVRANAGTGSVALCTHGDIVPEVLVALADEDHLDLGPSPRQPKGSVWILEAKKGRFVKATYLPPAG